MVIIWEESEIQPVVVCVNTNLLVPPDNPVIRPELVTEATKGFEEVHVPPDEGDNCIEFPTQIEEEPFTKTSGLAFIVTAVVRSETQP